MKLVECMEEEFLKRFPSTSIDEVRGKTLFVYDEVDVGFIRDKYYNIDIKHNGKSAELSPDEEINMLVALSSGNNKSLNREKKSYTEIVAEEDLYRTQDIDEDDILKDSNHEKVYKLLLIFGLLLIGVSIGLFILFSKLPFNIFYIK